MSAIRSRDTKPELLIRKGLHSLGFRFRLHDKKLPGHPDIVLRKYNAVILIHGCFWHAHDCGVFRQPRSNVDYWEKKIARNLERDAAAQIGLLEHGWRVLIVWECAIAPKDRHSLANLNSKVADWLLGHDTFGEIGQTS